MSDTLMRQWQMLRLIPRQPARISTSSLMQRLADEGFETTQRTIQRDLMRLSTIYPLVCDENSKPFGWSWYAGADILDIPGMDSHMALAFYLAQEHLEPLLPTTTMRQLQPHFDTASHVLDKVEATKGVPTWRNKVRVLHRGPKLGAPAIQVEIQNDVYDALLRNQNIQIEYTARLQDTSKDYEIAPLAIVLKEGITYLVCALLGTEEIRIMALHRIANVSLIETKIDLANEFNLDRYIATGKFDFVIGEMMQLQVLFTPEASFHLYERPLATDQTLLEQPDGRVLLTATVQDSSELRWWLLGFGDRVEVVQPAELRQVFATIATQMANSYQP